MYLLACTGPKNSSAAHGADFTFESLRLRESAGSEMYNPHLLMKTPKLLFALLLTCLSFTQLLQAQTPAREDAGPATVVIHAGHLLDVKSGRMIDNVTIVVQGDKIVSLGPLTSGTQNLKTIDL